MYKSLVLKLMKEVVKEINPDLMGVADNLVKRVYRDSKLTESEKVDTK